jgi:hypothetical protein
MYSSLDECQFVTPLGCDPVFDPINYLPDKVDAEPTRAAHFQGHAEIR